MIDIQITQTCDRCGTSRKLTPQVGRGTIGYDSRNGGWRQVEENQICPECIALVFHRGEK